MMTVATAGRTGRPPRHLSIVRDDRDELTAIRAEGREFAADVRDLSERVRLLVMSGNDLGVQDTAARMAYLADRQLRRLGPVA